jgi:hypothetical protein
VTFPVLDCDAAWRYLLFCVYCYCGNYDQDTDFLCTFYAESFTVFRGPVQSWLFITNWKGIMGMQSTYHLNVLRGRHHCQKASS